MCVEVEIMRPSISHVLRFAPYVVERWETMKRTMRWMFPFVVMVLVGLAFSQDWTGMEVVVFVAEENGVTNLYKMNLEGGEIEQISRLPKGHGRITGIACSRYGEKLAYVYVRGGIDDRVMMVRPLQLGRPGPHYADWTSEEGALESVLSGSISPDGERRTWVARRFEQGQSGMALFVSDLKGASVREVAFCRGGQIWSPTFSGDGTRIAYATYQGGVARLMVAGLEGEKREVYEGKGPRVVSLDWSWRGDRWVCMDEAGGIFIVESEGGRVRAVGNVRDVGMTHPRVVQWSADGSKLVIGGFLDGILVLTPLGEVIRTIKDSRFSRMYGPLAVFSTPPAQGVGTKRRRVQGEISLESLPPGADIYVDGVRRGRTPQRLRIKPGEHTIRMHAAFCFDWEQAVTLKEGEKKKVVASLERWGSLVIRSDPPGAEVFIEGEEMGVTPLRITPMNVGEHRVEVRLEGWEHVSTFFPVRYGQSTNGMVRLRKPVLPLYTPEDIGRPYRPLLLVVRPPKGKWAWLSRYRSVGSWTLIAGGLVLSFTRLRSSSGDLDAGDVSMLGGGIALMAAGYVVGRSGDKEEDFEQEILARNREIEAYNAETRRLLEAKNRPIEEQNRIARSYNQAIEGREVEISIQ